MAPPRKTFEQKASECIALGVRLMAEWEPRLAQLQPGSDAYQALYLKMNALHEQMSLGLQQIAAFEIRAGELTRKQLDSILARMVEQERTVTPAFRRAYEGLRRE